MKCKACGRKIANNATYCDKCEKSRRVASSQSRRSHAGKQTTKKVASGSVQRRSAQSQDSYNRYRKMKHQRELQIKRRRRRVRILIVWMVLFAIIAAIGGGLYAYNHMTKSGKPVASNEPAQANTISSTQQPNPVQTDGPEESEQPEETTVPEDEDEDHGCEIYIDKAYEFQCAYPEDFVEVTPKNNVTRFGLEHSSGDAEMRICYEEIGKTESASGLMADYVDGLGVDPDFKKAGDDWYSVTFTRNGRIQHRKAVIIEDTQLVYYDFTYEQGTDNKTKYEEYIDYIDDYIETKSWDSSKKTD